jgi:hypothetical protein
MEKRKVRIIQASGKNEVQTNVAGGNYWITVFVGTEHPCEIIAGAYEEAGFRRMR